MLSFSRSFDTGIMELGIKGLTPTDVVNLFNLIDKSGDGEIDYEEFILLIRVSFVFVVHCCCNFELFND